MNGTNQRGSLPLVLIMVLIVAAGMLAQFVAMLGDSPNHLYERRKMRLVQNQALEQLALVAKRSYDMTRLRTTCPPSDIRRDYLGQIICDARNMGRASGWACPDGTRNRIFVGDVYCDVPRRENRCPEGTREYKVRYEDPASGVKSTRFICDPEGPSKREDRVCPNGPNIKINAKVYCNTGNVIPAVCDGSTEVEKMIGEQRVCLPRNPCVTVGAVTENAQPTKFCFSTDAIRLEDMGISGAKTARSAATTPSQTVPAGQPAPATVSLNIPTSGRYIRTCTGPGVVCMVVALCARPPDGPSTACGSGDVRLGYQVLRFGSLDLDL